MKKLAAGFLHMLALCLLLTVSQSALAQSALKQIPEGTTLWVGQSIYSNNLQYRLTMQGDGNLVFYRVADARPLWNSQTHGSGAYKTVFEPFAVFNVLRISDDAVLWTSRGGYIGAPYPGMAWYITDQGDFLALYNRGLVILHLANDPDN